VALSERIRKRKRWRERALAGRRDEAEGGAVFEDFARVWTIVGLSRDLRDKPLPIRVAGQRVVLFRDREGRPAALLDRCPHRGVALSLGKVENGEIVCPFHGWRFNDRGENCHVPWNPDAKLANLGATALPVREMQGLLWLHAGLEPEGEPQRIEALDRPGVTLCAQSARWRVHWTRVMENMLDTPHLPFVHRRTIGRGLLPLVGTRLDMSWAEQSYGGRITSSVDGEKRDGRLDYRFPNAMELFIDPPGRLLRLMAICLPEDNAHTRLTIITIRDFARPRLFDPLFRWLNRRIAEEDRAIVESSQPPSVPAPELERSVRTDAPTLAFRRIYHGRLLGSYVEDSR
jgi:phenylpropionate dioxygenase-like ring-hydroxylating dioxygenase large terminal subunit